MTVIDTAGALTGAAARFRGEAARWVADNPSEGVRLIGTGRHVEPRWLARRELLARGERRIAANNVSWVSGRGGRVVLLQNALHFLRPGEAARLAGMPPGMARQVPVVRAAARRATRLVVPCTEMGERVAAVLPGVRSRLAVRHLPVSVRNTRRPPADDPYVLYPGIPAVHKDLVGHLGALVDAIERAGSRLVVRVTAPPGPLGELAGHPGVVALGLQSQAAMDDLWAEASAVYAPTTIESFGYPVAEARVLGVPVIAVDNPQNREIGGGALVGFTAGDRESLAGAVSAACSHDPEPDPGPFDSNAYFDWLVRQ